MSHEKKETEENTLKLHDESLISIDKFIDSELLFRFVDNNKALDEFTIDIDKHGKISDEDMHKLLEQDYVVLWEANPHQYIIRKNLIKMIKDKIRLRPNLYLNISRVLVIGLFCLAMFVSRTWTECALCVVLMALALVLNNWISY